MQISLFFEEIKKPNFLGFCLVRRKGVEPSRYFYHKHLKLERLPFRHLRRYVYYTQNIEIFNLLTKFLSVKVDFLSLVAVKSRTRGEI